MNSYRVRAHNAHTASENKIHDDDVARAHGFAGGLVPGVTIWAYLTRPCIDVWGHDFLERGSMSSKFTKPIYEGDQVDCVLDDDGTLTAVVAGEVRATGRAAVPAAPETTAPDFTSTPKDNASLPQSRPDVSRIVLATLEDLGSLQFGFHAEHAATFLDEIADDHLLFRGPGAVAHPGWLITFANLILTSNVRLGPWVHTGSEVRHMGAVVDGDRLTMRGRVADLNERKGHEFVDLDLVLVANDTRPVLTARHTAIYRLASRT